MVFNFTSTINSTAIPASHNESIIDLAKCLPSKDWLIEVLLSLTLILFMLLIGVKHEFIRALLRPEFSRFLERTRKVLSRSSEGTPHSDTQADSEIPENSRRLHSP